MINKKRIVVIGSSNTDMVVKTSQFPAPGETVLGGEFLMNPGGKGANQAVAAARLGAYVTFITKIGRDIFGDSAVRIFGQEGIDLRYLIQTENHPSGVALITVNAKGENSIVVASGANMALRPEDIAEAVIADAKIILLQLEIPLETVAYVIKKAIQFNKKVVLNPAPGQPLHDELLNGLYLITPNETETHLITGIRPDNEENIKSAGEYFLKRGVKNVIITLGSKGVFLINDTCSSLIPAPKVAAVDTTAAGDVFNGALVTALAQDTDWLTACEFACKAASVSVTKMGAQSSAPYLSELK